LKILLIFSLGSLAYICGIYFYINDNKKKWFHTIWHIFVILGSLIHINGLI
jgi:hemolysin III